MSDRLRRVSRLLQPGPACLSIGQAAAVAVASAAVYVLRCWPLHDKLWGEDASVFLTDARGEPLRSVLRPFNGYLQAAPHLLALPLRWVPVRDAPLAVIAATAVVVAVVAGVGSWTAGRFVSAWPAVVAGAAVAVLPVLGQESIASLANVQFLLVVLLFWLIVGGQRSPWALAVVAVVGLSTVLALALVPLALLAGWADRQRWSMVAVLAGCGVVQVVAHVSGAGAQRVGDGGSRTKALGYAAVRVVASLAPSSVWKHSTVAAAACTLVVGGLLVVALVLAKLPPLAVAAIGSAVWLAVVAALVGGGTPDRYLVAPGVLLVAGVASLLDDRRARRAVAGVAAVVVVAVAADFGVGSWRASPKLWGAAVAAASCSSGGQVEVPAGAFGWDVARLACSDLG